MGGLLLREIEVQKTEWFLLLRKSAVGRVIRNSTSWHDGKTGMLSNLGGVKLPTIDKNGGW